MNVTSSGLVKAAGAAAAVAGSIFIAVQVNHPAEAAFDTQTTEWVARCTAKAVMCVLALAGITGMYLRQHRQAGPLGLVGYVVFALGYLTLLSVEVIAAAVLPSLLDSNRGYVMDVVSAAAGGTPDGDIGGMQVLLNVAGAGYILGGLLFGIALFRTGILPRWASALLAVSTVSTAALAFLPEAFNRPFAVPEGIALIGLGVALWRNPGDARTRTAQPAAAVLSPSVR
jgi:peptidyl-tRNA hydrolase